MTLEEEFGPWMDTLMEKLEISDKVLLNSFIERIKAEYDLVKTVSYKQGWVEGANYSKEKAH